MLSLGSTPSFLVVSIHSSEVNSFPLSVMISCGSPCSLTISFIKRLANFHSSRSFEQVIK